MQFIPNGPDIPERLLQVHEDGRVVFFCGAGISYPAQLPGFRGLVERLFKNLDVACEPIERAAIRSRQFDTAVSLLEARICGGREKVRRALEGILKINPDLDIRKATETHQALLELGRNREGQMQLVTTNFDRLFEETIFLEEIAIERSLLIKRYQAPLLPVPKRRWDGLVYLHGLLTENPTKKQLDRLVLSSGDFGLAYLMERWAARFVSELFRNYTICFVGYSIDDPVLRYMMDAIAADRLLGEDPPEIFAFGNCPKDREEKTAEQWRAKNVTPILYLNYRKHFYLHATLHQWAQTYRNGVEGKKDIVRDLIRTIPSESTQKDSFVGRMLWALSDPSGVPAEYFANHQQAPTLEWLDYLSEKHYGHTDLRSFGVSPEPDADDKLSFSMAQRPTPYSMAPLMGVVSEGDQINGWDKVMSQLAGWLTCHLNDSKLFLWLLGNGGRLHGEFARMIKNRLAEPAEPERSHHQEGVGHAGNETPNGVPDKLMRKLWYFLIAGAVKSGAHDSDMHSWFNRFKGDGLTVTLRRELRENLTPKISLNERLHQNSQEDHDMQHNSINGMILWNIALSADNIHSQIKAVSGNSQWAELLPALLPEFTGLLREALDLIRELEGVSADHQKYSSNIYKPDMGEHSDDEGEHAWTILIDLVRDAWLEMAEKSPEQAVMAVQSWWSMPYPLFRRLAFFAAAQGDVIPARLALDWLLEDSGRWLSLEETKSEAARLSEVLSSRLMADGESGFEG